LWIGPDFWFLGIRNVAPRLLLLTSVMPEQVQELLRRKAEEVGEGGARALRAECGKLGTPARHTCGAKRHKCGAQAVNPTLRRSVKRLPRFAGSRESAIVSIE